MVVSRGASPLNAGADDSSTVERPAMRKAFVTISLLAIATTVALSLVWPPARWLLFVLVPAFLLGVVDIVQRKSTLRRNFPLFGRGRYLAETLRPKIYQYFVESDVDGTPINRVFRSVVYQRAQKERDTIPFGTEFDVYRIGYEWMAHSLAPGDPQKCEHNLRTRVGLPDTARPYHASLLNISAMSYGALSRNAIMSLNGGAQLGGFAHNTGEGGISDYHRQPGGDLIWQIGTGYFGCRSEDGSFCPEQFKEQARQDQVKMIEIKLSQGAKPGHGGILPAGKNTPEIAAIRNVKPGTVVVSPPAHSTFGTPVELMKFIQRLRDLSGGKPVGFKLCIGNRWEFMALCKAMLTTGIKPDFITVDGGEGGTGAAPVEYSNSVGAPLREGLTFVVDTLMGFDLKREIRVIASGKIISGFHIVRALALGADMVSSARGMMLALGCIQALECNTNHCPMGIATQNPDLYGGLDVKDKTQRVANFHGETIKSVAELLTAAGVESAVELTRSHVFRRISMQEVASLEEVYPYPEMGCLLHDESPANLSRDFAAAQAETFARNI